MDYAYLRLCEFGYLPPLPPGINVRQNVLSGKYPAGSVANSKQNYLAIGT
jgi:hypothetical protein